MKQNILIVSGHTNLDGSFANKTILDELKQRLPEAEILLLDKTYPDFRIDVPAEQQRLEKADVIVLQFPFFWYGMPSLMKKWIEDVFVYGFAHGSTGNKLHGKKLIISFTSGAPKELYQIDAPQNYPIEEFMPPMKQFANLCGLDWQDYVYTGGLSYVGRDNEKVMKEMQAKAVNHADRLVSQINNL